MSDNGPFDTAVERFRAQDIYIAVAAATHAQRHGFIDACLTGHEVSGLQDLDDASIPTSVVSLYTCDHENYRVHMVEIPDLDTADLSDPANVGVYRSMVSILAAAYGTESGSRLNGAIYIGQPDEKPLSQLLELVFGNYLTYVSFASGTSEEAAAICSRFLNLQPGPTLLIQEEFIAQQRMLKDTELGSKIFSALENKAKSLGDTETEQYMNLKQALASLNDTFADIVLEGTKATLESTGDFNILAQITPEQQQRANKNPFGWLMGNNPPLPRYGMGLSPTIFEAAIVATTVAVCNVM